MAPLTRANSKDKGGTRTSHPPLRTNKVAKSTNATKSKPRPLISSNASNTKPKRRPGRPFKMAPKAGAAAQEQLAQLTCSTSTDSPNPVRRLSMIETLPVELIHKIFFCSLELNFPKASLVIAAALSTPYIYRILILIAFWRDDRLVPLSPTLKRILAPVEYDRDFILYARQDIQREIFSFKWCTVERITEQLPTLINMTIHRVWLDAGVQMEPSERAKLQRFMDREDDSVLEFSGTGPLIRHFYSMFGHHPDLMMHLKEQPFHTYKLRISPMKHVEIIFDMDRRLIRYLTDGDVPTFDDADFDMTPALDLHHIPDHLLRGRATGFTAKDVAMMELLRMASASYKRPDGRMEAYNCVDLNRNLVNEGITKAIETKNYNAMISLLKLDEYHHGHVPKSYSSVVRYYIPQYHFIHVTKVGRQNPSLNLAFFEALFRTNAESVPADSPEVMQWAVDGVQLAKRNPTPYNMMIGNFARWLIDFMLTLPVDRCFEYDDPPMPLFTCGELNLNHKQACVFQEEVLAPHRETLGNWTAESTFRLEGLWVRKDDGSR